MWWRRFIDDRLMLPPDGKRGPREIGSATVEFALIFVVFFTLVSLVLQGVMIFSAWLIITNSVREGTRAGAPCINRPVSTCTEAQIQAYVVQASGGVNTSQLVVPLPVTDVPNRTFTVTASYPIPVIAPFLGAIVPDPLWVSAESVVRLENAPQDLSSDPTPGPTPIPVCTPGGPTKPKPKDCTLP